MLAPNMSWAVSSIGFFHGLFFDAGMLLSRCQYHNIIYNIVLRTGLYTGIQLASCTSLL